MKGLVAPAREDKVASCHARHEGGRARSGAVLCFLWEWMWTVDVSYRPEEIFSSVPVVRSLGGSTNGSQCGDHVPD